MIGSDCLMGVELGERENGSWGWWGATTTSLYNLILLNYEYMFRLIKNK